MASIVQAATVVLTRSHLLLPPRTMYRQSSTKGSRESFGNAQFVTRNSRTNISSTGLTRIGPAGPAIPVGRTIEKKTPDGPRYTFTEAQLDAYGIYELQVLEEVLRQEGAALEHYRTMRAVAQRIAKKIEWPEDVPASGTREFLQEYYAALRRRLEQRMLFGRRKEDKHDV